MTGTKKKSTKKTIKPGKDMVESTVEGFKEKILKIINQDIKELSIDLKNVKDIDFTGIGVLIAAKNSFDQVDGQLNLKNVPENIGNLLQVLGLDGHFNQNEA